jgi:hypothetical protein
MNRIISLSLIIGLIAASCTDSNTIGLEVQPTSDNIIISSANFEGLSSATESEDSLRTDEALNLILGKIKHDYDREFGLNKAAFYTQILLTENNTDLGTAPIVDSVILSYTYSAYYGKLEDFTSLDVSLIEEAIYKDSIYYSNDFDMLIGNVDYVDDFTLSNNLSDPFLRIKLSNNFGQEILNFENEGLKDNETFLENFKGISVIANAQNTMLYLNPTGSNSFLKIYYHNDESGTDTLSLDFELGGDAARINLFNPKPLANLNQEEDKVYIQSMAGYKAKITINNTDSIKSMLKGKAINKVTLSFDVEDGSQSEYDAHDILFLSRVNEDGTYLKTIRSSDLGINVFVAELSVSDRYEFNITRYFYQLLNNDAYTNDLYLLPAGAAVNANRTILNKDIKLTIHYSEL